MCKACAINPLADKAARFLELHGGERPLLLANAWDLGAVKLLESLGFQALASTSSGYAATLGRLDYSTSREQTLEHAGMLAAATDLPVSADLEDCFAVDAAGVAQTVSLARKAGLAGCSIEDWRGGSNGGLYDKEVARERVMAAAEVAHSGPLRLVLTARAENYLRGNPDLGNTIGRLQAYQEAGADVLYAPGVTRAQDIREILRSVDLPLNVLVRPGVPSVGELAALGVRRVSVGGAFAFAALAAARRSALELLREGTYGFLEESAVGLDAARTAFADTQVSR